MKYLKLIIALFCLNNLNASTTGTLDRVSGWYAHGSNVTVVAIDGDHRVFSAWGGDTNDCILLGNQVSFTVYGTKSIIANFDKRRTVNGNVPTEWLASVTPYSSNQYETIVMQDLDGDGFLTFQEYWSGTDPMDSESFLRIESINVHTNITIQWSHSKVDTNIPSIRIQGKIDLKHEWSVIGSKDPVDGTSTWVYPYLDVMFFRLFTTNSL